jgi:hypothetical protein
MRCEALMAVKLLMVVFWVVTPCGLVSGLSVLKIEEPGLSNFNENKLNRSHTFETSVYTVNL